MSERISISLSNTRAKRLQHSSISEKGDGTENATDTIQRGDCYRYF